MASSSKLKKACSSLTNPRDIYGDNLGMLLLSEDLGKIQGDRIATEPYLDDTASREQVKQIRQLLKHLSIGCDFKKGGETVTAIALQNHLQRPIFWISSNTKLSETSAFLREVLSVVHDHIIKLRFAGTIKKANQEELEHTLFVHITNHIQERLRSYLKGLLSAIKKQSPCLDPSIVSPEDLSSYLDSLNRFTGLQDNCERLEVLGRLAYQAKHNQLFSKRFQRILSRVDASDQSESQVRHYMGRLGCAYRAAKFISSIAFLQPHLFENYQVKRCASSDLQSGPSAFLPTDIAGLAAFLCADCPDMTRNVMKALRTRERDAKIELSSRIQKLAQESRGRFKVHAELLVLEGMYAAGAEFYFNDRFIGCSKPACFCCYHYIVNHPGNFVHPACHSKTWIKWLAPALKSNGKAARPIQRVDVIGKVTRQLRHAVIKTLLMEDSSYGWRSDSTCGMTESSIRSAKSDKPTKALRSADDQANMQQLLRNVNMTRL